MQISRMREILLSCVELPAPFWADRRGLKSSDKARVCRCALVSAMKTYNLSSSRLVKLRALDKKGDERLQELRQVNRESSLVVRKECLAEVQSEGAGLVFRSGNELSSPSFDLDFAVFAT